MGRYYKEPILCPDCNKTKKHFAKGKCKACYNEFRRNSPEERERRRLYRIEHAEEIKKKKKDYYEKNGGRYNKEYYQKHKEQFNKNNMKWREANPEVWKATLRKSAKKFRETHPEKAKENYEKAKPARIARDQIKKYVKHRRFIFSTFQNRGKKINRFYQIEAWEQRLGEMDAIFIDELSQEQGYNLETTVAYLQNKITEQNEEFRKVAKDLSEQNYEKRT